MPGGRTHCLSPSCSRNQLSLLPPYICQLPLRVLIVSNNKLGALPPDISALGSLRQLVRMGSRETGGWPNQALGTFGRRAGKGGMRPRGKDETKGRSLVQEAVSDAPGLMLFPHIFPCLSSFQDVSSNELQSLPTELCSLPTLRDLNVRRNQLSTLPDGEEKEDLEGVRGVCVCLP